MGIGNLPSALGANGLPPGDVRVRLGAARAVEVGPIARIYRAQSPEDRRFFHPFPFDEPRLRFLLVALFALHWGRSFWARAFPALGMALWVARDPRDGRPVAFSMARFRRDRRAGLIVRTGIYVAPPWRRTGVGRSLKLALLEECRRLGARRAEAVIVPSNTPALELNAALGYSIRPATFHDRRSLSSEVRLAELDLGGPASPAWVHRGSPDPTHDPQPS